MKNKIIALSTLASASLLSAAASAEVDVSAATTSITTDGGAAVTAIGTALIGLAGVVIVFKWAKASIFG